MSKKGKLIVLSGPSGVGKDTVAKHYIENKNAMISISATTRQKRANEVDGVNYYFLTKEQFEEKIKEDDFLEYAIYNDCYYGTPKSKIQENLDKGIDVILVIEVQGGLQIKEKVKDSLLIFLLPPNLEILEERLRGRMSDSEEMIQNRMKIALTEIEVSKQYDYRVVNDDLNTTIKTVEEIIEKEKE